MLRPHDIVLFQGDSITDAGRDRNAMQGPTSEALGKGYAALAAARLLSERPDWKLSFFNRGISGNKVPDLEARWDTDCLRLRPTVVSVLIGVNDTWHPLAGWGPGVPVDRYESAYRSILDRTVRELPGVRLVICEPFVLRCGAVDGRWFPEIDQRRAVCRQLASDFGARLVEFQALFDQAVKSCYPQYWAPDGVHPSLAGHALMAAKWVECVG